MLFSFHFIIIFFTSLNCALKIKNWNAGKSVTNCEKQWRKNTEIYYSLRNQIREEEKLKQKEKSNWNWKYFSCSSILSCQCFCLLTTLFFFNFFFPNPLPSLYSNKSKLIWLSCVANRNTFFCCLFYYFFFFFFFFSLLVPQQ